MDAFLEKLWKFFSSLKLALVLFVLLVISTMAGSIILQRPIAEPGQLERVYSPETIKWLDKFDLLDVFHSWWYLLQLFLLTINITIASIDMWPRFKTRMESFKPILNPDLPYSPFHGKLLLSSIDKSKVVERLKEIFQKKFRPAIVNEKEGKIFLGAESARWAHLGVYVIHTGLVLILIGGLIGNRTGFEGAMQLAAGESSNLYMDRVNVGRQVALDFTVHCVKTWMEKYPDGTPKSYFSDLEIIDEGKVVKRQLIKVNEPLVYKGIYLYQATFGQKPSGEKTEFTLEIIDNKTGKRKNIVTDFDKEEIFGPSKNGGKLKIADYTENVPLNVEGHAKNLGEAVQVLLSEQGEDPQPIWVFKEFPDFDKSVRKGKYQIIFKNFNYDYQVVDVTGLQVARNPGINIVWAGSAILVLGLLATFFIPHRKLWAVVDDRSILIVAASHRHPETFAKKVRTLIHQLGQEWGAEVVISEKMQDLL